MTALSPATVARVSKRATEKRARRGVVDGNAESSCRVDEVNFVYLWVGILASCVLGWGGDG